MALPVETFTSFDAVGNREDLTDDIFNIDPTETPFCTGIARVSATATNHEHQTDSLADATTQAYLEGDDATADPRIATVRPANVTQIFRRVISVTGTQRAVNSAGRADEYDYQLGKEGKTMKRNIEKTLLSTNPKQTGSTATARHLGGVATWLSSNKYHFAATSTTPGLGATIVTGNAAVTVTTASQFKDPLDTVIQQVWTAGGDPGLIMADGVTKARLSGITGIATLYRDVPADAQGRIVAGADHYTSNFGNHVMVPNRFMPTDQIYVLDYSYWAIATLRGMETTPLAKTGDSDRAMLLCELTLESRNEKASGKVADFVHA